MVTKEPPKLQARVRFFVAPLNEVAPVVTPRIEEGKTARPLNAHLRGELGRLLAQRVLARGRGQ
jgi:hypothetical protein